MQPFARLAHELEFAEIRMGQVRINEAPQDCCFCILNFGNEIECFYSERGAKFDLRSFTSQLEAITYFKEWVLSNETLYTSWSGIVGQP